jgi:hypothetical protein
LGQRHEALRLVRESAALVGPSAQARTEALAALALDDWQWIWQHHTPDYSSSIFGNTKRRVLRAKPLPCKLEPKVCQYMEQRIVHKSTCSEITR